MVSLQLVQPSFAEDSNPPSDSGSVIAAQGSSDLCSDIGIEVGKKIALKAFKNPERELQKLDKGIKREVLKEYKVLLEDDKKTAVESVDPFFGRLKALFQEASDALVGKTECKAPTTCEAAEVVPSQEDALPPSPVEVAC